MRQGVFAVNLTVVRFLFFLQQPPVMLVRLDICYNYPLEQAMVFSASYRSFL